MATVMTAVGSVSPSIVYNNDVVESPTIETVVESEPINAIEHEPVIEKMDEVEEKVEPIIFKVTAYCPCKECSDDYGRMTATGVLAEAGRTIAVDPSVIPYGTKVTINGNTYIAEDCGGYIKGNRIDIYFDSHQETVEFGVQHLEGVVDW